MRRARCSLRFRGDCSNRGSKKSFAEFPAFERMFHGRSDHKWTSYRRTGRLPSAFLHFSCNNKVAKASDASRAYLESLRNDGQPIPADKKITADPVKEEIKIALEPA